MRRALVGLAAFALAVGLAGGAAAQETGTVTVIHGVPGLTVDVYVNGELTLEGFEPQTVTDPLDLPAGDYEIEIREAGADPSSDPAIAGSAALAGGMDASIVAHLDEGGTPRLSVFVNDTSRISAGESRVIVRHTAAAPSVDVLADGNALLTNLANPDEGQADVPAATYSVAVAATGTTDPVLGPIDLTAEEGVAQIVYAWGSLEDGSLDVAVQTIPGLHAAPGVATGNSGLAEQGSVSLLLVGLLLTATVGLVGSGVALARRRR